MKKDKYDFGGWATKNDIQCSDGRTIRQDAFKHNDGQVVPLVWQHGHNDVNNVLGHALLENRPEGVYAFCKFNSTSAGQNAKTMVEHGDISQLSIFANGLKQQLSDVVHGVIREVSLVLSGANPGALIDNISIEHSDGWSVSNDQAVIYFDSELTHSDDLQNGSEETVDDVIDTMSEKQKNVMYALIGQALSGEEDGEAEHSDIPKIKIDLTQMDDDEDDEEEVSHTNLGGEFMKKNIFEVIDNEGDRANTLTHSQVNEILADAQECGSLREAVLYHADKYGIENIDILFPDAKTVTNTPDFIKRNDDWVAGVLSGTKHSPFSRIKSTAADVTADEARARGYIKGKRKKEEVIKLLKRVTTPTTIYKKQKLDRDDIIDITDLDVVAWLKAEMRMMLDEEIARAVLIGDGRDAASDDKINEENIRPIAKDDEMYAHQVKMNKDVKPADIIETAVRARKYYKRSGNPTLYTTTEILTDMLLIKDEMGRRIYNTEAELVSALRVSKIVEVEALENQKVSDEADKDLDLIGIMVNLSDYVIGADKGGEVNLFDDFDIDYNQYKYLMETRISGALVHPKSALVLARYKDATVVGDEVGE